MYLNCHTCNEALLVHPAIQDIHRQASPAICQSPARYETLQTFGKDIHGRPSGAATSFVGTVAATLLKRHVLTHKLAVAVAKWLRNIPQAGDSQDEFNGLLWFSKVYNFTTNVAATLSRSNHTDLKKQTDFLYVVVNQDKQGDHAMMIAAEIADG